MASRPHTPAFAVLALFACALIFAGRADAQAGGGSFELYGGAYAPEDDFDDITYGVRGGVRFSDRFGMELSAAFGEVEDVDFTRVDLSAKLYLGSGSRKAQVFLFAGPGWLWADDEFSEANSLTVHAGLAAELRFGEHAYLRPDVRVRWFEERDGADLEATLALGFSFGN